MAPLQNNVPLILASASPFRRAMLAAAGIEVRAMPARIDERAVEESLGDETVTAEDLALILAEAKACDVSERSDGALTIGADQTLALDGEVLHKVATMEEARRRLLFMRGRSHVLNSAVVLAHNGETVWRHVEQATITLRHFDPGYVGRYLSAAGEGILSSVGLYQIEGLGPHLFEKVEGDHFAIIGLPLLPLIGQLRERGVVDG